jgi:hypothetical protein
VAGGFHSKTRSWIDNVAIAAVANRDVLAGIPTDGERSHQVNYLPAKLNLPCFTVGFDTICEHVSSGFDEVGADTKLPDAL